MTGGRRDPNPVCPTGHTHLAFTVTVQSGPAAEETGRDRQSRAPAQPVSKPARCAPAMCTSHVHLPCAPPVCTSHGSSDWVFTLLQGCKRGPASPGDRWLRSSGQEVTGGSDTWHRDHSAGSLRGPRCRASPRIGCWQSGRTQHVANVSETNNPERLPSCASFRTWRYRLRAFGDRQTEDIKSYILMPAPPLRAGASVPWFPRLRNGENHAGRRWGCGKIYGGQSVCRVQTQPRNPWEFNRHW